MKNLVDISYTNENSYLRGDGRDEIDRVPYETYTVRDWEFLLVCVSIFCYIIDVFFDLYLSLSFYQQDEITYGTLTLLFVLIPSIITICICLSWDIYDEREKKKNQLKLRSNFIWFLRSLVMMLQLAPVLRYVDSLHCGWQCKKAEKEKRIEDQKMHYKLMLKKDADAAFLRVLECLLESAPQLVLQITIFMIDTRLKSMTDSLDKSRAPQALSMFTSLISIAWSIASYQRSTRFAQDDKENISIAGSILQFTWHFLIALSRVFSISVLASIYAIYAGAVTLAHSVLMAIWLFIWRPPEVCKQYSTLFKALYCFIVGLVHIFVYLSTTDGPNRKFYLFYYSIFFIENFSMLITYGVYFRNKDIPWYYYFVVVSAALSFFAGIITMLVYYGWFHPMTEKTNSPLRTSKNSNNSLKSNGNSNNSLKPKESGNNFSTASSSTNNSDTNITIKVNGGLTNNTLNDKPDNMVKFHLESDIEMNNESQNQLPK